MKNKKVVGVAVASVLAFSFCGGALVGCGDEQTPSGGKNPPPPTADELQVTKIADFETGNAADRTAVFATTGFENGDVFNTFWKSANVSYDNNMAELSISEMSVKEQVNNPAYDAEAAESDPDYDVPEKIDCQAEYYGGELRTSEYYGYGDYEVCMKPSAVSGTASTFFVCTGPYDVNYDTDVANPHDEIDIEFLGKDTTKVQFNYFVNDRGGHEFMYDLGFDASEEFHTYGFRWTAEYIVWFVDGKPVYQVKASKNNPMPSTAGRILSNYWTGTDAAKNWMGEFPEDYSGKAQYKYIATSAEALPDPTVAPEEPPIDVGEVPEDGWTAIEYSGFDGWGTYTVEKEDGINISHTEEVGAYSCCGMKLASNYSWVKFTVTNNSEEDDAVVRIDVKKETPSTGGIVGVVSEHEGVSYNSGDKAVLIELAAGESADVVCKISDDVTVDQMVVFLNSTAGATATAGDITISELLGIETEPGDDPEPVDAPKVLIGEDEVAFAGNGYTIESSENKNSMTVSYEDISGKGYSFISADVSDIIGDYNAFNFKLTNNGEETAKIRIDIKCKAGIYIDKNTGKAVDFCNVKAMLNGLADGDLVSNGNDYIYGGGDWIQIKAGGTVTGQILFKAGEEVGPEKIAIFIDSSTWDDETTHTGSVTISDMSFSTEEVEEETEPTTPEGEGWTPIDLTATGAYVPDGTDNVYTYHVAANSIDITHSRKPVAGSNLNVSPAYGANNFVHMKIKNNLDAAYAIRINVQNPNADYKTVILSATIDGEPIEIPANNYDGITVQLAANAEIVFEFYIGDGAANLCFGVNNMEGGAESGDVTISELCMKKQTYVAPPVEGAEFPDGEGWTAIDLAGAGNYNGGAYTYEAKANGIIISHTAAPIAGANVNHDVIYGENNLVHLEITNNDETNDAIIALLVQNGSPNWANVIIMNTVTVTGEGCSNEDNVITVGAGQTAVIEFYVGAGAMNIGFGFNSAAGNATEGNITISKLAMKVSEAQ